MSDIRNELEQAAERRFRSEPALAQYADILFYDWPNRDEHLRWVAEAPLSEIIDWAERIRRDEETEETRS